MHEAPNIVRIASLIGDYSRATVLSALMDGRALTATELANLAGVTKQTISGHLAKLLDAGLLSCEQQGRHRYFRLASHDVATMLETLMGVAQRHTSTAPVTGPKQMELRRARTCYDHLAGELAVEAFEHLAHQGLISESGQRWAVTPAGHAWFKDLQIDTQAIATGRRPICKACLDWSERRHHLAGSLGAALLDRVLALGWAKRVPRSRVVAFSPAGEASFRRRFGAS